jgi:DNA-binding CsgD family transcriptional regulator
MAEMRSQGKSFGEIADALGRSVGGVYTLDPHCTRKLWTPADEELLRSLRAAGKSYKTVTEYFPDRVFDQVTAKGKSLLCYPQGETERSWTPAEMELFIHLRDDLGLTIQQISHQMQRSKYSLMSMWKRISPTTKPRPSHYHPIELETTARMLAKGHSWREIASRLPNRVLASRRAYWYTVGTHKLTLHPDGTVEWHHSSSE